MNISILTKIKINMLEIKNHTHKLKERENEKEKRQKLIENFVFFYSTRLKVTCLHGYL
jgi:hypothetical protein